MTTPPDPLTSSVRAAKQKRGTYGKHMLDWLAGLGVEACVEVLVAAGRVAWQHRDRVAQVMRERERRARKHASRVRAAKAQRKEVKRGE